MSNTVGILEKAGTAYPSRPPEFTPGLLVGSVLLILKFVLCCPIMCLCVISSVLRCPLRFLYGIDVRFILTSSYLYVILQIVASNTIVLFCLSSSCKPNVANLSGLSILDCPFDLL
jgi:hypothetical protein